MAVNKRRGWSSSSEDWLPRKRGFHFFSHGKAALQDMKRPLLHAPYTCCHLIDAIDMWHNNDHESAMKNFHLPLPEGTYDELRAEAERAQLPATTVARAAIASWLRARKKTARRQAIREYAARMAGTRFDLDPLLEAAAIEELIRTDQEAK